MISGSSAHKDFGVQWTIAFNIFGNTILSFEYTNCLQLC